ncbi:MAG: transposase [Spirochaetia bacterium]|nr:transposase [Spirochaetia bacterium]
MAKILQQKTKNGEIYLFSQGPRKRLADGRQSTAKRISYGKLLANGTFTPNAYYRSLSLKQKKALGIEEDPQPSELERQLASQSTAVRGRPKELLQGYRKSFGDSYLFIQIAEQLKVGALLKQYWPNCWDKLLSVAIFMALNHDDALYLIQPWSRTHVLPTRTGLSSGNLSKLLDAIDEDDRQRFLADWASLRAGEDTYCVDGSSFSSLSQYLRGARWGMNKEHDQMPQINVLVAFGMQSHLPLFISSHAGNIPDISTMEDFVHNMYGLDVRNTEFCFDRGYCSIRNITLLIQKKHRFILAARSLSVGYIQQTINALSDDDFSDLSSYDEVRQHYGITRTITWSYPVQGSSTQRTESLYVHIYFNPQMALDKDTHELALIKDLEQELRIKPVRAHLQHYEKYFIIDWGTQDPYARPTYDEQGKKQRKSRLQPPKSFKAKPMRRTASEYRKKGLFVLLSNSQPDCWEAHRRYKKRNAVEKAFMNLKDRIGLRRLRSGQQTVVDSRIFIAFISLILISELERRMQDAARTSNLVKRYTMESLCKEFSSIDQYHHGGKARHITPITKKQKDLYELLEIKPPARTMTDEEQKACDFS